MHKYLTCVLSTAIALVALSLPANAVDGEITREITSNEILELAARGDTLWMVTANGLNYTLGDNQPLQWWGYKTNIYDEFHWDVDSGVIHFGIAIGSELALVPKALPENNEPNGIWTYDHATDNIRSIDLPWNREKFSESLRDSVSLNTRDIVWTPEAFWTATENAGIVRLEPEDIRGGIPSPSVAYPGIDSVFAFDNFPPPAFDSLFTPSKKVVRIGATFDTAGNTTLYAVTAPRVYTFSVQNDAWDTLGTTLSSSNDSIERFIEVFARRRNSRDQILAICQIESKPKLCIYDTTTASWTRLISNTVHDMSFGDSDTVYAVTQAGEIEAFAIGTKDKLPISEDFAQRLNQADPNIQVPAVEDVAFERIDSSTAYMWIATTDGLYFSTDPREDEREKQPLTREHRAPALESGLQRTYFYPTILAPYQTNQRGYFAYNLSESADVTIAVYDWNMDHVKTIIENEPREKGSDRRDGRSTIKLEDHWDGNDRHGKPVAPGVYYYKISSNKGERAFGKIVVAK